MEATLEVIGGKWKGVILFHLMGETRRFNELKRMMPGITLRMLTRQLRELEEARIVARKVYPEVPPKVEYSLTEFGRTLGPVFREMKCWGLTYLENIEPKRST